MRHSKCGSEIEFCTDTYGNSQPRIEFFCPQCGYIGCLDDAIDSELPYQNEPGLEAQYADIT